MDDASIALAVRSPQINNPVDTYGKLMSLRHMQTQQDQQSQMFPEQLKQAQLQNQEHEQAIKDQEIFAKAYRDSQGDLTKTLQTAAQNGASGKGIMQYNGQLATVRQKLATTDKTTLANDAARHDQLRGRLESFRSQPDDYKTENWKTFMEQAGRDGLLKPDEHKQWLQQYPEWNNDQGEMLSHSLASGHQLTTEAIQAQNAQAHKDNVANSTLRAKTAVETANLKTETQRTRDAATMLGTATDPEDYAQKLYSLDPKIREKFKGVAGGDEFDQEAVRKAADRIAMTPEERTRADQSAETAGRADERAAGTAAHQKILEAQGWARINKPKAGEKPMSTTEATRQARSSEKAENDQRQAGEQLASAIQGGSIYVDKSGRVSSLSTKADEKAAQIEDMRSRYRANAEAMKSTINDKYDAYERLGMNNPKVPRSSVLGSIDAGTKKLLSPPVQLPKGSGGKIDKDTAKKFYEAAGGNPEKARKLARDNNWKF